MSMFLDLAITERCNLNCVHCFWKDRTDVDMSVDMVSEIVGDFMTLSHPVEGRMVLLSGGEPTCHPEFKEIVELFRLMNWKVNIASNGYKVKQYVEDGVLRSGDSVQISVDGLYENHDIIRGHGSFKICLEALQILEEYGIERKIHYTLHDGGSKRMIVNEELGSPIYRDIPIAPNLDNIGPIAYIAKQYGCSGMCINYYHPVVKRGLKTPSKQKFLRAQRLAGKYYPQPDHCYINGCVGGLLGASVTADGTYWNCSRSQHIIGKYPQVISEVLDWELIHAGKYKNPTAECMRFVKEDIGRVGLH
jgi:sulfatase maturation enzyme AslB (radical SAM superfamily)